MGKKCIPGVICIENMTLFVLFFIAVLVAYMIYTWHTKHANPISVFNHERGESSPVIIVANTPISTRNNAMNDPYSPPNKTDGVYYPPNSLDVRGGIPVNIATQSPGMDLGYTQVGILTRVGNTNGEMILPLMGRRIMNGRDKWQYYAISNTGMVNTKLPISINGKSCTGEYGCDEIQNGDKVFVEGYKDTFNVTMYETSVFRYIPYL